jgi:two-component system, cell cycle sensor histidine kinase and response regulator CckA
MTPTPCADIRDPARLAALDQAGLLENPAEPAFDRLTRLAARVLRTPMSIISLVGAEHVFFKSSYGLPEPLATRRQAPLSYSFCQVVAAAGAPLIVPDTRLDALLQDDTAMRELGIVAYAGVPLIMPHGHTVGTLCALDRQPRAWSSNDIGLLHDIAATVVAEIQLRRTITERNDYEAQLLQLQKGESIGLLASGIVHDFNNLLTAIVGYADLALRDLPGGSMLRNDLAEIQKAANRANSLTRQLLAFLRKRPIEPCVFDLNALLLDMGKLLRRLMRENIELVVLPTHDQSHVKADPGQISQVLLNLAVNARDAMPDGGTLTIATANVLPDDDCVDRRPEDEARVYVMLAVSDTGVGLPEEARAHLFEPFFTTKKQGRGTGLGLATCQNIVRRYGGRICISSNVGHGTTIQIYLPRVDARQAEQSCCSEPQTMPLGTETVLLVEDEAGVRAVIAEGLRRLGYTLLEAANGDEALDVVCGYGGVIDLLLADVVMPHTGGGVLAERLRALCPALAVLLISGYLDCDAAQAMEHSLGAAFLQKPFTLAALARKIRDVLDMCSGAAAEER